MASDTTRSSAIPGAVPPTPSGPRSFFEQFFEQAAVAAQVLDRDGRCQRINARWAELFGVSPDQVEDQRYDALADDAVAPALRRVFAERQAAEWDSQRGPAWYRYWARPIFDGAGAMSHVVVQCVDVTAPKQLAAREEWYRVLFQKSPDALMTLAPPTWTFTSANPATLAMFRATSEAEFISRAPWEYSPPTQPGGRPSSEAAREVIERAMRQGVHSFDWIHRRASGEDFPATVQLARVELGGRALLQAMVRDETEKQRLQSGLAQSERLATMGMLAAGIAHEINNPLAYVLSGLEVLVEELPKVAGAVAAVFAALQARTGDEAGRAPGAELATLSPAALEELATAARSALDGTRRIRRIARGLGTFARVDRSEQGLVDVRQALDSAAAIANNELKYRAVLVRDYAEVPAVWASEGKLAQVFLNLLINAAHAIPDGDAKAHRITLRAWAKEAEVFVAVEDTGVGIAPELLTRIFEPFFTTKPPGKGTGLGLSICRSLVAEFGGELTAQSDPGRGARFQVRLPQSQQQAAEVVRVAAGAPPVGVGARGRVLVVDDESAIRAAVKRLLASEHEVVTAASGEEARELILRSPAFDVILCDLMMPEMSGMEFHAWLAGHDAGQAARVVFVTGGAFTPYAAEYVEKVRARQVAKPFEHVVLAQLVRELVTASAGRRPTDAAVT